MGTGGGQTSDELVISVATDILNRLPPLFNRDATLAKYPTSYHQVVIANIFDLKLYNY